MSELIVVLDIGTSSVKALAGELDFNGELKIVAMASHSNNGIESGMVINIESCVHSIATVLEEVQRTADCDVHSVFISISGSHISAINSDGAVPINSGEVTQADLDRVLDAARAVVIPANQKILHALPQGYVIDNQDGIHDPLGMLGVRLELKAHLITCALNAAQNLEKCVKRCGVGVEGIVSSQLAASNAVLTEDEKELGVCLIDIGAGTTDIAVFTQGAIRHTAVIPVAGKRITREIATVLRTPMAYAEEVKVRYACALSSTVSQGEIITVRGVGNRTPHELLRSNLAEIVEHSYAQLLNLAYEELRRSGFLELIAAGIVLTGGTAKMEGAVTLAENIFEQPVRIGVPNIKTSVDDVVNPIYATTVGLLQYVAKSSTNFPKRNAKNMNIFSNKDEFIDDILIDKKPEPDIAFASKVASWFKNKL